MSWFNNLIVTLMPLAPKPIVRRFARRYVAGEHLDEATGIVQRFNAQGAMCTIDYLGEFITDKSQATEALETYKKIIDAIDAQQLDCNVSVKPTQMGLLLDKAFCYQVFRELIGYAKSKNIFVRVEMEDAQCTSDTIEMYLKLRDEFKNCGIVLQAYLHRTLGDAREVMDARAGHFRLCKGIYVEPQAIAYQEDTLINKNYVLILEEMFAKGAYVGIATHNEELVWEAMRLIDKYKLSKDQYEFQMLLGVEPQLRNMILDAGHRLRVYIPYGAHWHAYSLRRFKENPALVGHILKNLFSRSDDSTSERRGQN